MDYVDAKALAYAAVTSAWNTACVASFGIPKEIRFDRVVYDQEPQADHWCRVAMVETDSSGAGFTADLNGDQKVYRSEGLLYVQLFAPLKPADRVKEQDMLAKELKRAMRGFKLVDQSGCRVIIRRARVLSLPHEDSMLRVNVLAEYDYYETEKENSHG